MGSAGVLDVFVSGLRIDATLRSGSLYKPCQQLDGVAIPVLDSSALWGRQLKPETPEHL